MDGNEKQYDFVARSADAGLVCLDPSLAVQSDMQDADINVIVARFGITGQMPQNIRVPQYLDYDDVFDFRSAMDVINDATKQFMMLPAGVRARFNNDPQSFLEFATDSSNVDEMVQMGLAVPKPKADTPPVPDNPA